MNLESLIEYVNESFSTSDATAVTEIKDVANALTLLIGFNIGASFTGRTLTMIFFESLRFFGSFTEKFIVSWP